MPYFVVMTPANSFQVAIAHQQTRGVLVVTTKGIIDHASMIALFEASAEAAAKYHCHRFFLDHRSSPLNLNTAEMLKVPDELADHSILNHKAAFLFNEVGKTERFLETACLNRGVNAKVFTDPVQALMWLTAGSVP